MIDQGTLKNIGEPNIFSIFLGDFDGAIQFGGYSNEYKLDKNEDFKWAPLADENFWTLNVVDIFRLHYDKKNKSSIQTLETAPCPIGCRAVIDTGSFFIYGP